MLDGSALNGCCELVGAMQVMANMKAVLEAAGGSFDNVVKTTVLLADMGDFAAVNEVYGAPLSTLLGAPDVVP